MSDKREPSELCKQLKAKNREMMDRIWGRAQKAFAEGRLPGHRPPPEPLARKDRQRN